MSWLSEHALTRYWKEIGLGTPERRFRHGDQVCVLGRGCHNVDEPWTVVADDTNRTPVRDPEPAYKLRNGNHVRYIYESELRPLEDDRA